MGIPINLRLYTVGSFAFAAAIIANAYYTREQFYTTCIYLVNSKLSMMALGNIVFLLFVFFAQIWKAIFFGALRDAEVEHLSEKIGSTIMDTMLMMTVFRDEFSARFIASFVVLLCVKIFHWLAQDRVDYIQQTPEVSRLTHTRIVGITTILLFMDMAFVYVAAKLTFGVPVFVPTMMILFGFEYLLLTFTAIGTICKYILNVIDMQREGRWESKGAYVLYLEFTIDMFKLLVYMAFFGMILAYYGIPLHIIRQLYITFVSFRRRVIEVIRYRKAVSNMDQRFPNATPEELQNADTCIVCREDMITTGGKKLPCGHILHMHCLRGWLEQQQVCPICRTSVLREEIPNNQQRGFQQNQQFGQQVPQQFGQQVPQQFGQQVPQQFGQQPIGQQFAQPNANDWQQYPGNYRPPQNAEAQPQAEQNAAANVNISPVDQIRLLQMQVASIAHQLQLVYNTLENLQRGGGDLGVRPGAAPIGAENAEDPDEEELLRRVLDESTKTAVQSGSKESKEEDTAENSPPGPKTPSPTPNTPSPAPNSPSSATQSLPAEDEEMRQVRQRRLMRFSQQ
eukprot:TRINITY_DN3992_c0_g1_i1.p1 TRINITY_DN3992_c0_g1~~TRINITY_DN3992_c0_g1_i1.p1  ORF type:complete len:566 (+),score=150.79 TRINITY_DN3992_c0_g1_i1:165-1862(+)